MGVMSSNKKRLELRYKSNPENFAYGQDKPWEDLDNKEKAISLFQEYGAKAKELAIETGKGMVTAGVSFADAVLRTSPVEIARNIGAGIKETVEPEDESATPIEAFQQGIDKSRARPLYFEKVTGEQVTKEDGSINWDAARKFIGSAAEAPIYAYSGGTEKVAGGLLQRVLTRTAKNLPLAGAMTGIQKFEEGTTEGAGKDFLLNALILSGISNVSGELRLPKILRQEKLESIEKAVGVLSKEDRKIVEASLKQGVSAEDIISNFKKVESGAVNADEVANIINKAKEESKFLLTEGKPTDKVAGEGFTMQGGVDSQALKKSKALSNYQKEVNKYNANPNPEQLKKVYAARKTKDDLFSVVDETEAQALPQEAKIEAGKNQIEIQSQQVKPGEQAVSPTKESFSLSTNAPESQITKPAKAASDVNKRLVESGFKALPEEELAQYTPITKAQAIEDVAVALEDWDNATKMALGQADTGTLKKQVLYNAVVNKAEQQGDIELMKKLAQSPIATERSKVAQELASAGFNKEPQTATDYMTELMKTREKRMLEKSGEESIEKVRSREVNSLKKEIKRIVPTKDDWTAFVSTITCKE